MLTRSSAKRSKSMRGQAGASKLPASLILHLMQFVECKSGTRMQAVCRSWRQLPAAYELYWKRLYLAEFTDAPQGASTWQDRYRQRRPFECTIPRAQLAARDIVASDEFLRAGRKWYAIAAARVSGFAGRCNFSR
jgi:hypothetical protein